MNAPARRRALLVGIARYDDERLPQLPCTAADVRGLHEVLADAEVGSFDTVDVVRDPNAARLRLAITEFLGESEPDELAVVYVSGHGERDPVTGEFHFIARDTDMDRFPETAVPATFLNDGLENCRARQRVAVLDCCKNGGFGIGSAYREREASESRRSKWEGAPISTRGVYVLASSRGLEASFAGGTADVPSLFTGEVVQALRSGVGDRDRDGRISLDELFRHVSGILSTRDKNWCQSPVMSAIGVEGAVYLAKAPTPAHRSLSAPIPSPVADGISQDSGTSDYGVANRRRLLGYYRDCVRLENPDDASLAFEPRAPDVVHVTGSEQLLSGTGADDAGLFPVPPGSADLVADAVESRSDLVYGYPVVVLLDDAQKRRLETPYCVPLLIRRLEIVQIGDGTVRLRSYGAPEPNPALARTVLGPEDAEQMLRAYCSSWSPGDSTLMVREIRRLLRDEFGLPCVEAVNPYRLAGSLDVTGPQSGARNTAVLMAIRPAAAVKKLLRDLDGLVDQAAEIDRTALGPLLNAVEGTGTVSTGDTNSFAPVVLGPLNTGQRAVLESAMSRRLTVATGPPGTGKTALIVNLVATAVAAGQSVLVASASDAAVDEVWRRCDEAMDGLIVRTGSPGTSDGDGFSATGGIDYRQEEKRALLAALAAGTDPNRPSLARCEAQHAVATRGYSGMQADFENHARVEAGLLTAGRDRAHARAVIQAALARQAALRAVAERTPSVFAEGDVLLAAYAQMDDSPCPAIQMPPALSRGSVADLDRLRARSAELGRARCMGTMRRSRFLSRLGIGSKAEDTAALCRAVQAWIENELTWRSLIGHAQLDDDALVERWFRAERSRRASSVDLLTAKLEEIRAADRAALQELADLPDSGSDPAEQRKTRRALKAAPAWAVTCLAARRFPLDAGLFDLVVIDEANQCSVAAVLPVLFRAKRAVVIGDPLQLPHAASLRPDQEAAVREDHGLAPGRLSDAHASYIQDSAFHALEQAADGNLSLDEHYRCHPDIARLADDLFYVPRGEPLTVLTSVAALRGVDRPSIAWIDQPGDAMRHDRGSWVNHAEAARVGESVRGLMADLPGEATIGIVTPFAAQAALLQGVWADEPRVRVGTAHTFQGGECDAVVFSLVAADCVSDGALRFLDGQANLWNVAITRARAHLIVVGGRDFWIRRGGLGLRLLNRVEAARLSGGWAHGSEFRDLLYDRPISLGSKIRLGEARSGYRVDAVVTDADGDETAIVLDPGVQPGTLAGCHLRLQIQRVALLDAPDEKRHSVRVAAWRLYDEAEPAPASF